jgi:hypothetical protein
MGSPFEFSCWKRSPRANNQRDLCAGDIDHAKSIVYADPAKGGAAGVYFAHVIDRLGIADQLKSKTILVPGAQAAYTVAKGEAEIGVAQTSEIVPVAGAQVLGPLPGEFRQHDSLHGGHGRFRQKFRRSKIAHPISHGTGRQARSRRERLRARMTTGEYRGGLRGKLRMIERR